MHVGLIHGNQQDRKNGGAIRSRIKNRYGILPDSMVFHAGSISHFGYYAVVYAEQGKPSRRDRLGLFRDAIDLERAKRGGRRQIPRRLVAIFSLQNGWEQRGLQS